MSWSSGMGSSPTRRASCPSRSLNLVCKIPVLFLGLLDTNTIGYYNFCLPHTSLRLPLPHPEATYGTGTAKRWQPRTPAMAAGLTEHVWTLREVLLFRVPPWPQLVGVGASRGGGGGGEGG